MDKPTQNKTSDGLSERERLIPSIYQELRALARYHMGGEVGPQTFGATGLVHEVYLRLLKSTDGSFWNDERQFFRVAGEAMRRILIERARAKNAKKRGRGLQREDYSESAFAVPLADDEILALDEALTQLSLVDRETSELVKLHYFVGLSWEEIAQITGLSTRTLLRRWTFARAWLLDKMESEL